MRMKTGSVLLAVLWLALSGARTPAQDLGTHFRTVKDGIHVYAAKPIDSNCTVILTQEGVVLIDSGHNPPDSHAVMKAVRQLTSLPVRLLINTEPHADHTSGHFVFSPPAIIVAAAGAGDSMRAAHDPRRWEPQTLGAPSSAEMRAALEGYRLITPHIEYRDKMTLNVGERTFELYYLKNVHSESDTAIWLPKERVLFAAASVSVKRFNNLRPFVSIPDTLAAIRMMRALGPEVVIPGHGAPGTVQILDDMERYYTLLVDRAKQMVARGKTLDEIKAELKMPETDDWVGRDRYPNNIEAAYRAAVQRD
jgi:cyclase